ncbi:unnamed protein product [Brachionus calyciflorus]|uniref:Chitin-binding type-2 domain-containing protein n=1 Tax=Brachionus calyciflorus TaxID=104777 RepID=A0A814AJ03_9BILA|nr:unnamed protein product [Brachionus calyciflorus]
MLKLFALLVVVLVVKASDRYDYQEPSYPSPQPIDYYQYPPSHSYHQKKPRCHMNEDYTSVPGSCSKFKRCSNGYLYILRCPKTLVWDSRWKTCVHKSQARGRCGKKYSQYNYQNYEKSYKTEEYPSYQHKEYNVNYPTFPSGASYQIY